MAIPSSIEAMISAIGISPDVFACVWPFGKVLRKRNELIELEMWGSEKKS